MDSRYNRRRSWWIRNRRIYLEHGIKYNLVNNIIPLIESEEDGVIKK